MRLTNCGRIAARNTTVLGLVAPTVKPWRNERRSDRSAIGAAIAAASDLRSRNVRTPRYTRYAPPTSFSAVNAATDCSASAPTPTATAITWMYSPSALPTTVSTATRRPLASARPTTNRTLGPGITITTNAVIPNASSRSAEKHTPSLSRGRGTFAAVSATPHPDAAPLEDSRTTASRTHFDRWSSSYESGPGARRLQGAADGRARRPGPERRRRAARSRLRHRGRRPPGRTDGAPRGRLRPLAGDDRAGAQPWPRTSPTSSFARVT